MFRILGPRSFLTILVCGCVALKTRTDQDRQIALTVVKGLIDRTDEAGGNNQSTSGFIIALQQNSFDMIWDSDKFWNDGIYSLAGATANHVQKISDNIPVSNLMSSCDAKLG